MTAGATQARLCVYGPDSSTPPRRILLAGSSAATLASDLAGAQSAPNKPCPQERGPAVEVVLAYPDGHQSQALAELYGCWLLHTATGERILPAAARGMFQQKTRPS